MPAYKPKPLNCPGITNDQNTVTDDSAKGVTIGGLAAAVNNHYLNVIALALGEQKIFLKETCTDCILVKKDDPFPEFSFSMTQPDSKQLKFDLVFKAKWTAMMEWKKKPEVLKPTNVTVKQPGGTADTTIATIKYECIDTWIWVLILNREGTVELARERTDQRCPITAENPLQEYGWEAECDGEYWWVVLKDPKTKKPILKKKTNTKCEKEKEKAKEPDKGKDKDKDKGKDKDH